MSGVVVYSPEPVKPLPSAVQVSGGTGSPDSQPNALLIAS